MQKLLLLIFASFFVYGIATCVPSSAYAQSACGSCPFPGCGNNNAGNQLCDSNGNIVGCVCGSGGGGGGGGNPCNAAGGGCYLNPNPPFGPACPPTYVVIPASCGGGGGGGITCCKPPPVPPPPCNAPASCQNINFCASGIFTIGTVCGGTFGGNGVCCAPGAPPPACGNACISNANCPLAACNQCTAGKCSAPAPVCGDPCTTNAECPLAACNQCIAGACSAPPPVCGNPCANNANCPLAACNQCIAGTCSAAPPPPATPWWQAYGLDVRVEGGYSNSIPATATCGPYAIQPATSARPGVVYSGTKTPIFGAGRASLSPFNWVVGGSNPVAEVFPPPVGNIGSTSYAAVASRVQDAGITATDITTVSNSVGVKSCFNLLNCTLPDTLKSGVYKINGNVKLDTNQFPGNKFPINSNYIFLIKGNLRIMSPIHIPTSSTAFFTATGDIIVDRSVGI